MLVPSKPRNTVARFSGRTFTVLAALVCTLGASSPATAQAPTRSGFPPQAPPLPESAPKPADGPGSVTSLVRGLSRTDASFEVIVGQGRILTTTEDFKAGKGETAPLIALGDPTVADFQVIGPRQIRLIGQRMGVTDLSIVASEGRTFTFEINVVADLDVLRARLHCLFPDASLRLGQVRDHIVVEGQARDSAQVSRIMEVIRGYLSSVEAAQARSVSGQGAASPGTPPGRVAPPGGGPAVAPPGGATQATPPGITAPGVPGVPALEQTPALSAQATGLAGKIINLIRVPTSQQVLLKVRVAELNRTAIREIGVDWLAFDKSSGTAVGTGLGSASISGTGTLQGHAFTTLAIGSSLPAKTTLFGIFDKGNFELFFNALRRNQLLKILAEPNLVALNGQRANFLSGGQFFIPTAQAGAGGLSGAISAQAVDFGVRLDFLAHILDDDVIRLTVDPEVSSPDFTVATTLVAGGSPVPGLNKRSAHTTVELRQGQTLAIAGLMSVTLDGTTNRIPGLGDLPIFGTFFSNTTGSRTEKELIVLVTPYLVEPLNHDQVPPSPGDEVNTPNDLEFYLLSRLEGRTGRDFRATTEYDDAVHVVRCLLRLHEQRIQGPSGYCE